MSSTFTPVAPAGATVPEVAEFFGVSTRTIRRRIADGSLGVVRIGRSVRIPLDSVERLMNGASS